MDQDIKDSNRNQLKYTPYKLKLSYFMHRLGFV
jgi:hypothetical protein